MSGLGNTNLKGLTFKIALPVIIGVTVVYFLFRNDFDLETFRQIRFTGRTAVGIIFLILAFFAREFGMAWRFNILTSGRLNLKKSFYTTFLCEFTSAITPSSVGGSALSMMFMNREGIELGKATSYTLVILFLDNLFFCVTIPIIGAIKGFPTLFDFSSGELHSSLEAIFWIAYGSIAAISVLLGLGIFIIPHAIKKLINTTFRFKILKKWKPKADIFAGDMLNASRQIKEMGLKWWSMAFIATCISWLGRFLVVNAIFYALIPDTGQVTVLFRQFIVWTLLMFTPTPGGSGLSEWLFDKYYGDLIPTQGLVFIIAVIWRLASYYVYLLIGIILLPSFIKKFSHGKVPQRKD